MIIHLQNSYTYDSNSHQWNANIKQQQLPFHQKVKLATYNVLYGHCIKPINFALRNQTRFSYQVNTIIPQLSPDILCINEASKLFQQVLMSSKFIQQNYHIKFQYRFSSNHQIGIISKYPFKVIPNNKIMAAIISLSSDINHSIIMICVHFTAYEELYEKRKSQIKKVKEFIEELKLIYFENVKDNSEESERIKNCLENNNIWMAGDMNLHQPFENEYLYENKWVDQWIDINPLDEGKTWDSNLNNMIKYYLFLDNRRMRLDRICALEDQKLIRSKSMKIFGNESIGFGLWASDHFGLILEGELTNSNKMKQKNGQFKDRVYGRSNKSTMRIIKVLGLLFLLILILITTILMRMYIF